MCAKCDVSPEVREQMRDEAASVMQKMRSSVELKLSLIQLAISIGPAGIEGQKMVVSLRDDVQFLLRSMEEVVTPPVAESSAEERART